VMLEEGVPVRAGVTVVKLCEEGETERLGDLEGGCVEEGLWEWRGEKDCEKDTVSLPEALGLPEANTVRVPLWGEAELVLRGEKEGTREGEGAAERVELREGETDLE